MLRRPARRPVIRPAVRRTINAAFLIVTILWLAYVVVAFSFFMAWSNPISGRELEVIFAHPRVVLLLASPLIPILGWALFVRWAKRRDPASPRYRARDRGQRDGQ